MATQEERLTAVEKFTQVAAGHIRDTEENVTIPLGVIRSQGQDIRRIFETLDRHTQMLQQILDRLPEKE